MKLIIDSYARRSRKDRKGERTDRDLSTAGQHLVNLNRIETHGGVLGEKLTEKGRSAWQPGVPRPKFDFAVERLGTGASQGICIYDIDRMLRRVADALRVVEIAEQGFVILDADGEYDLMTPNGRENFYQRAVAAEAFSHKLSNKVKRGYATKALLGEGKNGRYRPLGFELDATTVREEERGPCAAAALAVLHRGATWDDAATILNKAGLLTGAGNPWIGATARNALLAPRMAGKIVLNGVVKGQLPGEPILAEADWQELSQLASKRGRGRPASPENLCSRWVRCGNCGNTVSVNPAPNRRAAYVCRRRNYSPGNPPRGCGQTIADRAELDAYITELAMLRLENPAHKGQIEERRKLLQGLLKPHEQERARLLGLREYWDRLLLSGGCDQQRHEDMTSALTELIRAEEEKIATLHADNESLPVPVDPLKVRRKWLDLREDSRAQRELLMDAFAGEVVSVTPGSVRDSLEGRVLVSSSS